MSSVRNSAWERRDTRIAGALLLAVFLSHGLSRNATPFDSRWSVPIALSLLRHGDTNLDEYVGRIERSRFYMIECVSPNYRWRIIHGLDECPAGHLYNFNAIAVPLLATPVIGAMLLAVRVAAPVLEPLAKRVPSEVARKFLRGDFLGSSALVELLVASFFMALATVAMYAVVRTVEGRPVAVVAALVFAYATPVWSLASRGLWQHGPSMALLVVVMLLALRGERSESGLGRGSAAAMGAVLALAFFVRSTNAVPAAVFTLYMALRQRRRLAVFLPAAAAMTLVFAAYNQVIYGVPLAPYSWVQRAGAAGLSLHPRFVEALAGNLVSPGRGLFVYVPVALLSVYGMFLRPPGPGARRLRPYLITIVGLHWVLVSLFEDWIGGHGFGPRYMSDMTPVLVWFLVPVLGAAFARAKQRRWALPALVAVLVVASVGINFRGATHWACWEWNTKPVDINQAPGRVWDWRDPAFLR